MLTLSTVETLWKGEGQWTQAGTWEHLTWYTEKSFHHDRGQTLEEQPREAAKSPSLETQTQLHATCSS